MIFYKDLANIRHLQGLINQRFRLSLGGQGIDLVATCVAHLDGDKREKERQGVEVILTKYFPELVLDYLSSGKPVVGRGYISISHTHHLVVVGVSEHPIGVDIERHSTKIGRIKDKILHHCEYGVREEKELLRIWSLKEAMYKLHPSPPWSFKKYYYTKEADREGFATGKIFHPQGVDNVHLYSQWVDDFHLGLSVLSP